MLEKLTGGFQALLEKTEYLRKKMLKRYILAIILIIAVFGWLWYRKENVSLPRVTVLVGKTTVKAEVAQSIKDQVKGLSDRTTMGDDEGMLFVYPTKRIPTFWMKGMKFPLDIIWIAGGKVVDFTENIQPPLSGATDNQLQRYSPSVPVDLVLEVNAGFIDAHKISNGLIVEMKSKF